MGWYDPQTFKPPPDPVPDAASAEAAFRTDLIAVLREIRDALLPPNQHGEDEPDADAGAGGF